MSQYFVNFWLPVLGAGISTYLATSSIPAGFAVGFMVWGIAPYTPSD